MQTSLRCGMATLFFLLMAALVLPFITEAETPLSDPNVFKQGISYQSNHSDAFGNSHSNNGIGPLEQAVLHGRIDTARELLEQGTNPNSSGRMLLAEAIVNGHYRITLLLLDHGADPNFVTPYGGVSALMEAASRGKILIMKALIEKGADVNYDDYVGGGTALNSAIEGDQPDAVRLLLEHGADPSMSGKFHDYPWKAARELTNKTILDILKKYKSNCHEFPNKCI